MNGQRRPRAGKVVERERAPQPALRLRRISFGSPAAIVTSTGLIVGLHERRSQTSRVVYLFILWGLILLSGLSYLLARAREVSALSEIFKHCAVALAVVALSKAIGIGIRAWIGQA